MSYEDPVSQRSMVLDEWRNSFYKRALASVVTAESVVLDVGSGLGVLGFIAAGLGAKKVYMVEPETNQDAVKLIAQANGLQDRVELIKGTVEEAAIPEKVDVITSVFTGNFLLEEDLLPSLFFARDSFLKPGGLLLPGRGVMKVVPVSLQEYYDHQIGCWKTNSGSVDHSSMHSFAVNQIYFDSFEKKPFRELALESPVCELDFYSADEAGCDADISMIVTEPGILHGFIGWFDMSFEGDWLSTSPRQKATHWSQAFLPIDPAVEVAEGDVLRLKLHRPQYGQWSWILETEGSRSQHSTFLSRPFTPSELQRKSLNFSPVLSKKGRVLQFLLGQMDGKLTSDGLALQVHTRFPELFSDQKAALNFVRKFAEQFGE